MKLLLARLLLRLSAYLEHLANRLVADLPASEDVAASEPEPLPVIVVSRETLEACATLPDVEDLLRRAGVSGELALSIYFGEARRRLNDGVRLNSMGGVG